MDDVKPETRLTVTDEAKLSFIIDPKKHNLAKLHKELDKVTMEAVQYLASVIKDDKADIDQKMKAAKDITDFKLKVSSEINKEFLTRLVHEARVNLAQSPKKIKEVEADDGEPEEDDTPMYTPDVILEVNNVKNM